MKKTLIILTSCVVGYLICLIIASVKLPNEKMDYVIKPQDSLINQITGSNTGTIMTIGDTYTMSCKECKTETVCCSHCNSEIKIINR